MLFFYFKKCPICPQFDAVEDFPETQAQQYSDIGGKSCQVCPTSELDVFPSSFRGVMASQNIDRSIGKEDDSQNGPNVNPVDKSDIPKASLEVSFSMTKYT